LSVLNLLLWSTTPLFGLAALLGISRFERWLLEDRQTVEGANAAEPEIVGAVTPAAEIAPAMPAQPVVARATQTAA
jgi:hypothetical protein